MGRKRQKDDRLKCFIYCLITFSHCISCCFFRLWLFSLLFLFFFSFPCLVCINACDCVSRVLPEGLDSLSAGLLFGGLGVSVVFLLLVFYLDSRPKLVMRLINKKLLDEPEADRVI